MVMYDNMSPKNIKLIPEDKTPWLREVISSIPDGEFDVFGWPVVKGG